MGRIMAFDYGRKRVGIAVSDAGRMIAQGLTTVHSKDIWTFLEEYILDEEVDLFVIGYPVQMNNQPSEALQWINPFIRKLKKQYPGKEIVLEDERFTSKIAQQTMIEAGVKKSRRQEKMMTDKISATLILQSFMLRTESKV